jgi:hypothetical protein
MVGWQRRNLIVTIIYKKKALHNSGAFFVGLDIYLI